MAGRGFLTGALLITAVLTAPAALAGGAFHGGFHGGFGGGFGGGFHGGFGGSGFHGGFGGGFVTGHVGAHHGGFFFGVRGFHPGPRFGLHHRRHLGYGYYRPGYYYNRGYSGSRYGWRKWYTYTDFSQINYPGVYPVVVSTGQTYD